jgi:hypothetical protein
MAAAFTPELGERFARVALANLATEYPHQVQHLFASDADARTPRALHPVFWGSYDWHSSVHMHWTLARCLRLARELPGAARARSRTSTRACCPRTSKPSWRICAAPGARRSSGRTAGAGC